MNRLMNRFTVRCYQVGQSEIRVEKRQAINEAALRQTLAHEGKTVLRIQAERHWSWRQALTKNSGALIKKEFPVFCKELLTLLRAGMTVVEAIEVLTEHTHATPLAQLIYERLAKGEAFSQALTGIEQCPPILIAAVRAGERTSNLPEALDDYLAYARMLAQLRTKIISAAIYPLLVTGLGLGITVFLLMVVMPNFAHMYEGLRSSNQGLSAFVIEWSQWVNQHRPALGGFLVLALGLASFWVWTGRAKAWSLGLIARVPFLREPFKHYEWAMVYQAIHLLLKGGYPLPLSLEIAAQSALNAKMKAALGQVLLDIESGKTVAQTLFAHGMCDEVDRRLMSAAEKNGDFYRVAAVVSGLHRERFETFVERATRLIEPILLLAVALMVGAVVVLMYLPVFDLSTQIR